MPKTSKEFWASSNIRPESYLCQTQSSKTSGGRTKISTHSWSHNPSSTLRALPPLMVSCFPSCSPAERLSPSQDGIPAEPFRDKTLYPFVAELEARLNARAHANPQEEESKHRNRTRRHEPRASSLRSSLPHSPSLSRVRSPPLPSHSQPSHGQAIRASIEKGAGKDNECLLRSIGKRERDEREREGENEREREGRSCARHHARLTSGLMITC